MGKSRVADIAKVVGLHPNTIRNWADKGLIESKRDFRGWRIIPDKLKAIQTIQGLMNGEFRLESHESKQTIHSTKRKHPGWCQGV